MKDELKIIGIQADLIWENPEQNIAFFEEKINTIVDSVDLIVLPEMFTTGFTMNPEKVTEKMDGFSVSWMQKIAKEKEAELMTDLMMSMGNHSKARAANYICEWKTLPAKLEQIKQVTYKAAPERRAGYVRIRMAKE